MRKTYRKKQTTKIRAEDKISNDGLIRLNKHIAMSGVASRRRADELIYSGKVRVNGKTITTLGARIDPEKDSIFVSNKPIKALNEKVYVMFNKPVHVVASMNVPEGLPSIRDYFRKVRIRLFPVGKLDWEAEGLVLLTNDGTFAQKITGPKNDISKTYLVKLNGQPSDEQLNKLVKGISIIGGKTHALAVKRMSGRGSEKYDWVKIIINESRNRQIRLMFAKIGFDVKKLQRIAVGSLKLANLDRGEFKILSPDEIKKVFLPPKEITSLEKTDNKILKKDSDESIDPKTQTKK